MTTPVARDSRRQLALVLLWPPLVAVAGVYFVERRGEERLARALADRPPIAVIDHFAFVHRGGAAEGVEGGLEDVRRISARLGADGYLVLDRRYLDAVPEPQLVRP